MSPERRRGQRKCVIAGEGAPAAHADGFTSRRCCRQVNPAKQKMVDAKGRCGYEGVPPSAWRCTRSGCRQPAILVRFGAAA